MHYDLHSNNCLSYSNPGLKTGHLIAWSVSVGRWPWVACDLVDRVFDSRSKSLGFDNQCWSPLSGKLLIPYYLCLTGSGGYLVDESYVREAQAACILVWPVCCILTGEMRLVKLCVSYAREGNWLVEYGTLDTWNEEQNFMLCTMHPN